MKKNSFYTIGSLIILLICAFVFVVLPALTGKNNGQNDIPAFGKYDGAEIRYEQGSEMADFVSNYGQMYQNYGQQIDSSTYYYIFNYAFNSTVTQMAYKAAVKKSGYEVPESAVNRSLIPYFYDETGKYSSKLYKQTPASNIQEMKNKITNSLSARRYYDDLFGSESEFVGTEALYGMKESNAEMDFLNDFGKVKRGFEVAKFSLNDYPEEKVIEYGKVNAAKFTKYDLSIITCAEKSTAEKLSKRIKNGEITFFDAISEYSEKNYSNSEGKLNNSLQYQIEKILVNKSDIDVLANLPVDSDSDLIETEAGFSIFHVNGTSVKADMTKEETVKVVSSYLKSNENGIIEDYFVAKGKELKNKAASTDFTEVCEELAVENFTLTPFPINYGAVSIATSFDSTNAGIVGAESNENFFKTAYALKMNEISDPIVVGNNVLVLKYTNSVVSEEDANLSELTSFDESALQTAILDSPKLENNFTTVYFQYFMN